MSAETPLKEVVCLIFQDDQNRVLLEQRLDEGVFHLSWMFPGGKFEPEDYKTIDPLKAASVREAWEETRLVPQIINRLPEFDQVLEDGREFRFHGVHVLSWSGELQNPEFNRRNLAWKTIDEAGGLIGDNPVDQQILSEFLKVR